MDIMPPWWRKAYWKRREAREMSGGGARTSLKPPGGEHCRFDASLSETPPEQMVLRRSVESRSCGLRMAGRKSGHSGIRREVSDGASGLDERLGSSGADVRGQGGSQSPEPRRPTSASVATSHARPRANIGVGDPPSLSTRSWATFQATFDSEWPRHDCAGRRAMAWLCFRACRDPEGTSCGRRSGGSEVGPDMGMCRARRSNVRLRAWRISRAPRSWFAALDRLGTSTGLRAEIGAGGAIHRPPRAPSFGREAWRSR